MEILDKIRTADNRIMIYYKENKSYPYDVKTQIFKDEKGFRDWQVGVKF